MASNEITPERLVWLLWCEKQMAKTANLLPAITIGGWSGRPSGWLMYLPPWRQDRDLVLGLITMFSARTKREMDQIRGEIIDEFYGGEESFERRLKEIQLSLPNTFPPQPDKQGGG